MNLAYPYRFDSRGRTAEATDDQHVRDLIEQVLFVSPGERVMRPDFGSNVAELVFAPNSPELAGATQMLVHSSLQRWLGEVLSIEAVNVESADATLRITVQYRVLGAARSAVHTFSSPGVTP
jgi:phage baseplate assembly protein W